MSEYDDLVFAAKKDVDRLLAQGQQVDVRVTITVTAKITGKGSRPGLPMLHPLFRPSL